MRATRMMLALLVVAGCKARSDASAVTQSGEVRSASDAAAVRSAIESANAKMVAWYASNQVDSIANAYASDAVLMPPSTAPISGREALRSFWKEGLGSGAWRFTFITKDVATSGDIAVERGTYTLEFTRSATAATGAPPSFKDKGNYVVHWVRDGDRWLIKWDAAVSDAPMAMPKPK
jgi:ketosteroid isomerase-like protein